MNNKRCTFIGHSRLWGQAGTIEAKLYPILEGLITHNNVQQFYCGGMGEFDLLCASVVRKLKRKYSVQLFLIIPYLTREITDNGEYYHQLYDEIIRPEELMGANYKAAIGLRNRWMIEKSAYAVCYVKDDFGGAYKSFVYAKKHDIIINNLADK